ncbi:hypothetical protein GJ744_008970 [Endocarpon pusillum]|uniref:Fungal lipase-like domain-containing protein n=1 Tax=Endocarpon pusillum TaxID=364733 RepID=A0A8H7E5A5_9EURO|nr:hypothetical protein GJ744_008970 [Endocarpon pusillum]
MLQVISVLCCLIISIYAAPTSLVARDVSADVLGRLNLWEQYAAAAYCVANNNSPGTKVTCAAGNCPLVEAATTTTLIEFQNSLLTDVTGLVAVDSTNQKVVVSFRGSKSARNWLTNIDFIAIPSDICLFCGVHQGFWKSWVEARPRILTAVEEAVAQNPGYGIVSTGHSLGGALATLAAANLRNSGYDVALYTYGSPQVGTQVTANYISNQPGGNYRVTHTNDIVPKLPSGVVGYGHVSPEYFIKSGNNVPVTSTDIDVIQGISLTAGNQGTFPPSIDAHLWYFNAISACSPGGFEFKE